MSPVLIKFIIWLAFTMMFQIYCTKFREKHEKSFESVGMDIMYVVVKFGVPAALMSAIGLAREINLWLGIVS